MPKHVKTQYTQMIFIAENTYINFANLHNVGTRVQFIKAELVKFVGPAMQINQILSSSEFFLKVVCAAIVLRSDDQVYIQIGAQSWLRIESRHRPPLHNQCLNASAGKPTKKLLDSIVTDGGLKGMEAISLMKLGSCRT